MISFSSDQKEAVSALLDWYEQKASPYITLGGYAGTGKTTLITVLRKKLYQKNKKDKVAFVSFTGKAARVLDIKLKQAKAITSDDYVGTIHSLIYSPVINDQKEIVGWDKKEKIDYDLIIVDEASMVNSSLWTDLSSYDVPIIAVGDHGQLPPVEGSFNLMEKPDLVLEQIHRQARDNKIIKVSQIARKHGQIPALEFSDKVWKKKKENYEAQEAIEELLVSYDEDTLVLCGYNNTRVRLNNYIRQKLGFDNPQPRSGDRVICLRNNHEKAIYNGMLGTISYIQRHDEDWYQAEIEFAGDKEVYDGLIYADQFNNPETMSFTKQRKKLGKGDLFDFGYALTVHKAQGSQARRVILFEQRFKQMTDEEWRRWLYTAVTRAEEELYIFGE